MADDNGLPEIDDDLKMMMSSRSEEVDVRRGAYISGDVVAAGRDVTVAARYGPRILVLVAVIVIIVLAVLVIYLLR